MFFNLNHKFATIKYSRFKECMGLITVSFPILQLGIKIAINIHWFSGESQSSILNESDFELTNHTAYKINVINDILSCSPTYSTRTFVCVRFEMEMMSYVHFKTQKLISSYAFDSPTFNSSNRKAFAMSYWV